MKGDLLNLGMQHFTGILKGEGSLYTVLGENPTFTTNPRPSLDRLTEFGLGSYLRHFTVNWLLQQKTFCRVLFINFVMDIVWSDQ